MSEGHELTNGLEELPPRREVRSGVNAGGWRIVAGLALLLASASLLLNGLLYDRGISEAAERRDQNCLSFEGKHAQEVRDLDDQYAFLLTAPRERWDDTQTFVYERTLPALEREAVRDNDPLGERVPAYCDEPGVGLAEPDPCIPKRPQSLGPPAARPAPDGPCRRLTPPGE